MQGLDILSIKKEDLLKKNHQNSNIFLGFFGVFFSFSELDFRKFSNRSNLLAYSSFGMTRIEAPWFSIARMHIPPSFRMISMAAEDPALSVKAA